MTNLTDAPWERDGAIVQVIVETPRGSRYKYALDPGTRALRLRFMLPRGLSWPYDYGFVPQTLCDDGDPADVVLIMEEPALPLVGVRARLLGGFEMSKDGVRNDRLVACPVAMPGIAMHTDRYATLQDLESEECRQLERFLCEYAEEQGHQMAVQGHYGPDQARDLVKDWHKAWKRAR